MSCDGGTRACSVDPSSIAQHGREADGGEAEGRDQRPVSEDRETLSLVHPPSGSRLEEFRDAYQLALRGVQCRDMVEPKTPGLKKAPELFRLDSPPKGFVTQP